MRVSAILTLAFAAYVFACASYNDCHCYDSNGVPNNGATKSVCDHFGGSMIKAERETARARRTRSARSRRTAARRALITATGGGGVRGRGRRGRIRAVGRSILERMGSGSVWVTEGG
ncbi:hypothetical protein CKAH01_01950 [Colletotrichum kahawae]|uniref:Uncharacterized protein n=1 Tax=Colletotrichum kahawae TaxID=34407 RepID=A0AAE0D107_COLKA|nr:hypothetical protein CKAH01_01950 [Colletotrichum kahawae]